MVGFHLRLQPPGRPLPLASSSSSVGLRNLFFYWNLFGPLVSCFVQLGTVKVGGQRFTVADPGEPQQVLLK
jgi:hypothetical protein